MTDIQRGYLYIIQVEDGAVKIGISIEPERRIAVIQSSSGRYIVRRFISPLMPDYGRMEKLLHQQFAEHRTCGEWFSIKFDDAVKAAYNLGIHQWAQDWVASPDYLCGASHRHRMRAFTSPDRTQAEWDAFFVGMGQEAIDQIEFAEQLDSKLAADGLADLSSKLISAVTMAAYLSITQPIPQEVKDSLEAIRAGIRQDMLDAGINPSIKNDG